MWQQEILLSAIKRSVLLDISWTLHTVFIKAQM